MDGAFPVPRDQANGALPVWAIAIVASSVGVTLLWLVAIVLLVTANTASYFTSVYITMIDRRTGGVSSIQRTT